MPINTDGYNATFQSFVDFARIRDGMGEKTAIARVTTGVNVAEGALAGRTITASDTDSIRGMFKWFRSADDKAANNEARKIFKDAIVDMFGGESKIPEAVKKAMVLADYDKGKPLTARRILAVKAAIDASGTKETRIDKLKLESFQSPAVEKTARDMGYMKAELPKLARAAHFYAQAKGVSEADAMQEVGRPGSTANRLMQYGGRFLASADNFANGLRLMDSFKDSFTAMHDTRMADIENFEKGRNGDKFANAKSVTDFNFPRALAIADSKAAFERFVFEELAVNQNANLAETDPEKLFGVKDNAAMRFFATERHGTFAGVMASVPPEKRGAIFAVFDKLSLPIPETKEAAKAYYEKPSYERGVRHPNLVIGRILRHLPEIERLMANGALTEGNIAKTLFPDMPSKNWTLAGLNDFTHNVNTIVEEGFVQEGMDPEDAEGLGSSVQLIMEETCCTLKEGIEAYKTGKRVAPPPYMTTATFALEKLDGTTKAARDQLDGNKSGDLWRAYDYAPADDDKNAAKFYLKTDEKKAFGFSFPDGTVLKANSNIYKGNIPTIVDKLESLAGKVHPRQQSALMFAVSQAGNGALRGGLNAYGISSSEHACVNFALSKDENTGAITVKYSSPDGLPLRFSWSATIDVDGNMTSTPMVVEKPLGDVSPADAKKAVESAVKDFGLRLGKDELNAAANLYAQHAKGMYAKNANYLAHLIVKLPLDNAHVAATGTKIDAVAKEIKGWSNIELGDGSVSEIAGKIKTDFNGYIAKNMPNAKSYGKDGKPDFDNVFGTMITDANRGVFVINGQRFDPKAKGSLQGDQLAAQVISAFKQAVPTEKAQKAISTIMHQGGFGAFITMGMKVPYSPTGSNKSVILNQLPGGEKFVARDMMSGHFMLPLLDDSSMKATLKLDVAPDGNTATLTLIANTGLTTGNSKGDTFGNVELTQKVTFDLRPEVPVVTNVQLGQQLL